jgi:hypothetical protein
MSYGNAGLPRFNQRTEQLTDAERRILSTLGPSMARNAARLGMSPETYRELLDPLGRVRPVTLARVRAKIAELQNLQNLQDNP